MRDWLLGRLVILSIQRSERGRSQTEFRKYIHIQKIYLRKSEARLAPWNPETQLETARSRERQAVLPTENLIGNFFLCKAPHNLASAFPKRDYFSIGPLSLLKAERFSNVKKITPNGNARRLFIQELKYSRILPFPCFPSFQIFYVRSQLEQSCSSIKIEKRVSLS